VKRRMQQYRMRMTVPAQLFWTQIQRRAGEIEVPDELQPLVAWLAQRDLDEQRSRFFLLSGRSLYSRSPSWLKRVIRRTYLTARRLR